MIVIVDMGFSDGCKERGGFEKGDFSEFHLRLQVCNLTMYRRKCDFLHSLTVNDVNDYS